MFTRLLSLGVEPPPRFHAQLRRKLRPRNFLHRLPSPLLRRQYLSLNIFDPIVTHLANTIDNLALYVASNSAAASKVADVLETAKADLSSLVDRIEKTKEEG